METILIVDDSPFNVSYLSYLLEKEYRIIIAENGTDGLEMAKNEHPTLILLDIEMPGLTGFQVIEKLQASKDTQEIPVVFLTGIDDTQTEEHAFFSGAVDFIRKPFSGNVVRARVRTHVNLFQYRKLLETQMYTDVLTDVYTRKHCLDYLNEQWLDCIREGDSISLGIADIDFFKKVNDTFGHLEGDRVLRVVAKTIQEVLQRYDGYIARIGGEEFLLLLRGTSRQAVIKIMTEICDTVCNLEIYKDGDCLQDRILVTISIGGVTITPDAKITPKQVEKIADNMLYTAKRNGRNRVEWAM